jgi:hypothetical protein
VRVKKAIKKIQAIYRTSGAPNTGKVIEIAKEKGHWKKQDAEQGKQAEIQARSDASPGHIDIHTNNRPPPRGVGRKRPRLGFQP